VPANLDFLYLLDSAEGRQNRNLYGQFGKFLFRNRQKASVFDSSADHAVLYNLVESCFRGQLPDATAEFSAIVQSNKGSFPFRESAADKLAPGSGFVCQVGFQCFSCQVKERSFFFNIEHLSLLPEAI
jgi:hypothetical protein